jgi:hypothetical protein
VLTGDAVGWGVQRRLGPLADRDLRKVHTAVHEGIAALDATRLAHPVAVFTDRRLGWRLPAHHVRLISMPKQVGTFDDDRTALSAIYDASDEASAIIVRLAHLLVQEDVRWRICACGCGQWFIKQGKQRYAMPKCSTSIRQRRKRLRDKATRQGHHRSEEKEGQ